MNPSARRAAAPPTSIQNDPSGPNGVWSWAEIERSGGGPTICGNELRLQFEGTNTFAAWLEAIERARSYVYFENYLLRDDDVGREFREALISKAKQGVPVHLIHDWLGCWATPSSYWRPMVKAGVHVRAFNRPALGLGDPFGVLQRDHRKLVVVDGEIAHVGGMCVGVEWAGTRSEAPWRDTGVEIRGPAAHAAALAFERLWSSLDRPLDLAGTLSSSRSERLAAHRRAPRPARREGPAAGSRPASRGRRQALPWLLSAPRRARSRHRSSLR
jgi:cardiolipin synthase